MATTKERARQGARTPRAEARPETGRLGKGRLQSLVLEHLDAHRGEDLSPSEVGKALGRSSGAVGNALHKFARDPESPVVQTSTKPRRYSIPKAGKGRTRAKR